MVEPWGIIVNYLRGRLPLEAAVAPLAFWITRHGRGVDEVVSTVSSGLHDGIFGLQPDWEQRLLVLSGAVRNHLTEGAAGPN